MFQMKITMYRYCVKIKAFLRFSNKTKRTLKNTIFCLFILYTSVVIPSFDGVISHAGILYSKQIEYKSASDNLFRSAILNADILKLRKDDSVEAYRARAYLETAREFVNQDMQMIDLSPYERHMQLQMFYVIGKGICMFVIAIMGVLKVAEYRRRFCLLTALYLLGFLITLVTVWEICCDRHFL